MRQNIPEVFIAVCLSCDQPSYRH